MQLTLLKILSKIQSLYRLPKSKRFKHYLHLLHGNAEQDILLPIAGYNPMGNILAISKLEDLIRLDAEGLAQEEIELFNSKSDSRDGSKFSVGINLVDDLEGAWSHYYDTDYKNRFEMDSIFNRSFITPIFYTSEEFTEELIKRRLRASMYRSLHWNQHSKPENLEACLKQEVFVQSQLNCLTEDSNDHDFKDLKTFLEINKDRTETQLIFNFFYGDKASDLLAYNSFGINEHAGNKYAAYLATKSYKI